MRASTLVGLGIALMLGVVVVAGVRYSGILSRGGPPPKAEPPKVLVANRNLYAGTAAINQDAALRPATPAEQEFIKNNPGKVAPLNPQFVHLRTLARDVTADEMLLKEYFKPMVLAPEVASLLSPGMRAVDIVLPKDRAVGGLLRTGEYVDVLLTSKIQPDRSGFPAHTAIAQIATNLKVIVKRGALGLTLNIPVPEDKPLSFIVEANPYRAALVEFAKLKGNIALVDNPSGKDRVDSPREKEREQELVDAFLQGKTSIGEEDLVKIFHLPPVPLPLQPLKVVHMAGTKVDRVTEIDLQPRLGMSDLGYRFMIPDEAPKTQATGPANTVAQKGPQAKKK